MSLLRYVLPFTYLCGSRLKDWEKIAFLIYYEWIPGLLLLHFFVNPDWIGTFKSFCVGYLAFIAIYEIGYFANDLYSTKFERHARVRINNFSSGNAEVVTWVGVRIAVFAVISWYFGFVREPRWIAFYAGLAVTFALHNCLRDDQLKVITFINLATFRFMSPFFMFLGAPALKTVMAPVVINYVVYRLLSYIDSKALLNMPDRRKPSFHVGFYLLILPVNVFMSVAFAHEFAVVLGLYYLAVWLMFLSLEKKRPGMLERARW